uniref:MHC_I-like_Ag-recog domain-containing protein n=1 Tax=Steinernema glaseri TaxID=37863 RepID=A0A1I7YCJ1_9BILA
MKAIIESVIASLRWFTAMLALQATILLATAALLLHRTSGNSTTLDNLEKKELHYFLYDHSRPNFPRYINVTGEFHLFEVFIDAQKKIIAEGADWCALGVRLRQDGIHKHWSIEQQDQFTKQMKDYHCDSNNARGFYEQSNPIDGQKSSVFSGSNTVTVVIVVLCVVIALLFLTVVVLVVMQCRKNNVEPRHHSSLESVRVHSNRRSQKSSKDSTRLGQKSSDSVQDESQSSTE